MGALFFCLLAFVGAGESLIPPPCNSKIYCIGGEGTLLHTVQMAGIFKDSKTFVDKPLAKPEKEVLDNFKALQLEMLGNHSSEQDIRNFVEDNFLKEGSEFQTFEPKDWKPEIPLFNETEDLQYRAFAKFFHNRWKHLGRKVKKEVKTNQDRYSLIYLDNPFIVPGGRFREVYYWDSYWTILGLLVSKMHTTVKGMLENFSHLVEKYGMIPNGNRLYYTRRSQPPLFIQMVEEYNKAVGGDKDFIAANIDAMETEFLFWINNRLKNITIRGKQYTLAHYNVEVDLPRPEGYKEDYELAEKNFETKKEKQEFYMEQKTGAESGWDFSTKWFISKNGTPSNEHKDIKARFISPVELNSYLCKNARILSDFFSLLGNSYKAKTYEGWRKTFETSIDEVLWNEKHGIYFDYDFLNRKQRKMYLVSNVAPLWANCYKDNKYSEKAKKVIKYMDGEPYAGYSAKPNSYYGGIPTSFSESGQQWDYPNCWPPMQELVITAMENTDLEWGKQVAKGMSNKYLQSVYRIWKDSHENHTIFEKYNVNGEPGSGGEYGVVEGFGWTNGVAMFLLDKYKRDNITPHDDFRAAASLSTISKASLVFPGLVFLLH